MSRFLCGLLLAGVGLTAAAGCSGSAADSGPGPGTVKAPKNAFKKNHSPKPPPPPPPPKR